MPPPRGPSTKRAAFGVRGGYSWTWLRDLKAKTDEVVFVAVVRLHRHREGESQS